MAPAYAVGSGRAANTAAAERNSHTHPARTVVDPLDVEDLSRIKGIDGDDVSADLVGDGGRAAQWRRREGESLATAHGDQTGCAFLHDHLGNVRGSTADQPRVGRAKGGVTRKGNSPPVVKIRRGSRPPEWSGGTGRWSREIGPASHSGHLLVTRSSASWMTAKALPRAARRRRRRPA